MNVCIILPILLLFITRSHTSCPMTCVIRPVLIRSIIIIQLKKPTLSLFVFILVVVYPLELYKLFNYLLIWSLFFSFLWWTCIQWALFACLVYIVAIWLAPSHIWIWMIIFLYFLSYSGTTHKPFIIWVLLVWVARRSIFIVTSNCPISLVFVTMVLKLCRRSWSMAQSCFIGCVLVVFSSVLVICCLLSSSLLHCKLVALIVWMKIWGIKRCCSVCTKNSFVHVNLLTHVVLWNCMQNHVLLMECSFWCMIRFKLFIHLNIIWSSYCHCVKTLSINTTNKSICCFLSKLSSNTWMKTLILVSTTHEVVVHMLKLLIFFAIIYSLRIWSNNM